ncbi:MAG: hypothetical protein UY48_C0003G0066 [Candidatus Gottesmanbacteria bacterium GW2011_GWB1_49_7]|uniref:Uncharacterized protein n=1 Tax=Candidatus Gottesmanbacteria bacterium GW2011_GWB1_49_7 TaxID=1618448 RepID=A0A0G1Z395_9BACT|nr:MAG: hypothetical protein UY48_C0003G0066 [Candidatus Gottesmanbacteria bacterium GW2011_GWB1_49_7]
MAKIIGFRDLVKERMEIMHWMAVWTVILQTEKPAEDSRRREDIHQVLRQLRSRLKAIKATEAY